MRFIWLPLLAFGGSALAAIGGPPQSILTSLSSYTITDTSQGYRAAGVDFSFALRGGAVYSVSGNGTLDEQGTAFIADLIGAASGYGKGISQPVAQFLEGQAAALVGKGEKKVGVEEYVLGLTLSGAAPYHVSFNLALKDIPADAFPPAAHELGPMDAKYVIREFSDFQCPYCRAFALNVLPQLKKTLLARDDVRFEFHYFPLASIHPNALIAAQAAECVTAANSESDFWTYHDVLFKQQDTWAPLKDPVDTLVKLAAGAGLKTAGVKNCITQGTYKAEIEQAYRAAVGLGLRGTPTLFVNGFEVRDYTDLSSYQHLMKLVNTFSSEQ
jgi:protein-disulfide isomerase